MKKLALIALLAFAPSLFAQSQNSNTMNFQGVTPPAAPVLTALTPTSGYVGNAVTVGVVGTGFSANCTATFNGVATPLTFVSATSVTLAVPAGKVVVGNNPVVVSCPLAVLTLNSPVQLPNAQVGKLYSADLKSIVSPSCNFSGFGCNFNLMPNAPTWLTLSASGIVSGTPSGAGSFSFTYTITNTATISAISRVHFNLA